MALSGTYSKQVELFDGEVSRGDCYIKIRNMVASSSASANIDILSDKDGFLVDQVEIRDIPLDLAAENYHTQIYNHLKTLRSFEKCKNC